MPKPAPVADPAVAAPSLTAPAAPDFSPQFTDQGLGVKSRWEELPAHLANLADEVARSRNQRKFWDDTMRRALQGETLDDQDQADTGRKHQTLQDFMQASTELDDAGFNVAVSNLKDAMRARPGAPTVVAPQPPSWMQTGLALFGAALDPKNAAQIGALPGEEGLRRQKEDQVQADRNYQAQNQQYEADVDAAKLDVDVAGDKLKQSQQLAQTQHSEQRADEEIARKTKENAAKERQDFAQSLIGKRVKTVGDLSQLQAAAKLNGSELPPEYIEQAKLDIAGEKINTDVRKEAEKLLGSLRNSSDRQTRNSARQQLVSLAQTHPDAFPDPEGIIAAYSGPAEMSTNEKLDTVRISGQSVLDALRKANAKVANATASRILQMTPMEAEKFAAQVDEIVSSTGVNIARATEIAIDNETRGEKNQADVDKIQAEIQKQQQQPKADLQGLKTSRSVVDSNIKELRSDLKDAKSELVYAAREEQGDIKKRITKIESDLAKAKKERDGFDTRIKKSANQVRPVLAGPINPDPSVKQKRDRKDSHAGKAAVKLNAAGATNVTYKGKTYTVRPKS